MTVSTKIFKLTIASSGTESSSAMIEGYVPVALYMPSAFTGTALTFQASLDNSTFLTMADGAGSDISKTVAASKAIPLNPQDFAGVKALKVTSGSSEAAERVIQLIVREV